MKKPYATDTGTQYDEAERSVAEEICRANCNRGLDRRPSWCPNWNWHVYEAKDAVERHRAMRVLRQMLDYFQAVSTATEAT